MDRQIQCEYGYVWTWKFLNPEKIGADSKISGYVWTGPQILKLITAIVIISILIDTNQKKRCMYPILGLRDVAKKSYPRFLKNQTRFFTQLQLKSNSCHGFPEQ